MGDGQAQPTVKHAGKRQKLKYSMRAWKVGLGEGRGRYSWSLWAYSLKPISQEAWGVGASRVAPLDNSRGHHICCSLLNHGLLELCTKLALPVVVKEPGSDEGGPRRVDLEVTLPLDRKAPVRKHGIRACGSESCQV